MTKRERSWKILAYCSISALAGMAFVVACGEGPRTSGAQNDDTGCVSAVGVSAYAYYYAAYSGYDYYGSGGSLVQPCMPQLAGRTVSITNDYFTSEEMGYDVAETALRYDNLGRASLLRSSLGIDGEGSTYETEYDYSAANQFTVTFSYPGWDDEEMEAYYTTRVRYGAGQSLPPVLDPPEDWGDDDDSAM